MSGRTAHRCGDVVPAIPVNRRDYVMTVSRRNFLASSGIALAAVSQVRGRTAAAAIPEAPLQSSPSCNRRSIRPQGRTIDSVVTLNGLETTPPWRENGV